MESNKVQEWYKNGKGGSYNRIETPRDKHWMP